MLVLSLTTACETQKLNFVGSYIDAESVQNDSLQTIHNAHFQADNLAFQAVNWDFIPQTSGKDSLDENVTFDKLERREDVMKMRNYKMDSLQNQSDLNAVFTQKKVQNEEDFKPLNQNEIEKNEVNQNRRIANEVSNDVVEKNRNIQNAKSQKQFDNEKNRQKSLSDTSENNRRLKSNPSERNQSVSVVPIVVQKKEKESKNQKTIEAKNDTINLLKKRLATQSQLNSTTKTDTVFVQKSITIVPLVIENTKNDSLHNASLLAKNDSIGQLKKQLKAQKALKTPTIVDTVFVENRVEVETKQSIEPELITAKYALGKTIPENDVFGPLIRILKNKNVHKVELSGFTDSSGNVEINKHLTNKRLSYIHSKIQAFVPIDKIYLQNFGQTFASKDIKNEERKVEIKIYYKP